ncbi:Allatostatin-A receptor, partial [Lamellibrachia satsuma]
MSVVKLDGTDNVTFVRDGLNISYNVTDVYHRSQIDFMLYTIIVPILFGLITLIGTLGNSLVIYVILSENRMRTVTNLLLLNLAFADLSFVLICPPFTAHQFVTDVWPFGDVVCKLMHYLLNVTAYVTVYTLVLISAIRYMTIVHNVRTATLRTKPRVVLMICAIWVVMLVVNVPILRSYGVQQIPPGIPECENYGRLVAQRLYATFFAFAYLLPLSVIGVLSVFILHHIQRQRPAMINKKTKSQHKKRQASRLIILVVVIFALFWLPVHIHLLVAYFGKLPDSAAYQGISVMWNCLAYFNSCVNPIIYNFASQEFRERFRKVICCRRAAAGGSTSRADDLTVETRVAIRDNGIQLKTSMKYRDDDDDDD